MSEQPRNEGKKGGGWRELPQGFDAKPAGSPAEPQPEGGDDTWILEGAEEEALPGAGAPTEAVGTAKQPLGAAPTDGGAEPETPPEGVSPEELLRDLAPEDAPVAGSETGPIDQFTPVEPVGFRTEAKTGWAGEDLSATQLGMDLAEEERSLREMEMSFASGVEDVEFTLVGSEEEAGATPSDPAAGTEPGKDAEHRAPAARAPGASPWKLPPLPAPTEAAAAALAAKLGSPRRAKAVESADAVAGAGSETVLADQTAGPTDDRGSAGDQVQPPQDDLAETLAALSDEHAEGAAPSESLDEQAVDPAGEPLADELTGQEPAEESVEFAGEFETAPEDAVEEDLAAEPEAAADEGELASDEPEPMELLAPRRRGGRWLRTAAAAAVVLLGGTVAVGVPWSEPPATDTPTLPGPVDTTPRQVVRAEIPRPVTRFELTPPVVSLTGKPTGPVGGPEGTQPVAASQPAFGPGQGPTPPPGGATQTPRVVQAEDDELLQALDRALAGVPTTGGQVPLLPSGPGTVAPAPGPADLGGNIMALTSGSRALALLRNGSFFIGKVKRVDAAAVTLHLGTGELTLPRVDLKQLVALGAAEYQELAQGGSVLLKNRNRLVGHILQSQGQEGVTLDLQTAKITIPKEDIEEITTRLPAPIEFGKEDDEVWFKRELEKERDRARRAAKGLDIREEGEGPAIKVLGTVEDLKTPPKGK